MNYTTIDDKKMEQECLSKEELADKSKKQTLSKIVEMFSGVSGFVGKALLIILLIEVFSGLTLTLTIIIALLSLLISEVLKMISKNIKSDNPFSIKRLFAI